MTKPPLDTPLFRELSAPRSQSSLGLERFTASSLPPEGAPRSSTPRDCRDLLRDEKAATSLSQLLDALTALPWRIEPGGTRAVDKAAAASLRANLERIDFDKVFREMSYAVWYGYSVAEVLWLRGVDAVEIGSIRTRARERFRFTPSGEARLLDRDSFRGEALPPRKFWIVAMPTEHGDRAHGEGAARQCYWPIWLKRHALRFWATALERFGSPTPIGRHAQNASEEEVDQLLETLQHLVHGAGIAMPEGQTIELLEATRRSGGDYLQFCDYMDRLIVGAILLQTSTTEIGPWKGTAEIQKLVRDERVSTLSRLVCHSFTNSVGRWLSAWNYPEALAPRLVRDISVPEDLSARAGRDATIAAMSGLRPSRRY